MKKWEEKQEQKILPGTLLKVLANGGIFPGIFLGISVEMMLAGLRDGLRDIPLSSQQAPFPRIFLGIFLGISFH